MLSFSSKLSKIQSSLSNQWVFYVAALLVFSSCTKKKNTFSNAAPPNPIVDVIIASNLPVSNKIEVNGTVVANEFVQLMPETAGRITYLNVPEGKFVRKGTVIARINDADLQAQLKKTQVQLELAKLTEQRSKRLLDIKGINQADYDLALNQMTSLEADMAITQASIAKTVIVAPFDGYVGLRQVSVGASVTTSSIIATMQELSNMKVDFTIPSEYQAFIKKGSNVDIRVNEISGKTEQARIIAIEPQVNLTTRNITIRASLGKTEVNPGDFVKVFINPQQGKKSIQIPTNSIIPESMSKKVILVKNGLATMTPIKTGVRNAELIEVVEGLQVGDSVVVNGVLFARPGKPVNVRSVKTLELPENVKAI